MCSPRSLRADKVREAETQHEERMEDLVIELIRAKCKKSCTVLVS